MGMVDMYGQTHDPCSYPLFETDGYCRHHTAKMLASPKHTFSALQAVTLSQNVKGVIDNNLLL
jgi:hypothetical protein